MGSQKYNFDRIIDRKNTNSIKWDFCKSFLGHEDLLPMWIADTDFECAAEIVEAVKKVATHGIYGYSAPPESYFEAAISWMFKKHGWQIKKEWILSTPGIVSALNIAVQTFTKPGDKVIVQSPVYPPFFQAVLNNGRFVIDNPLKLDKKRRYTMDFDLLEKQIDCRTKLLFLCSPHNPVGRVWKKEELKKLAEIAKKHNLIVVSDEIHGDIVFNGHKHTPFASISNDAAQRTITCTAPSKTFNIAGLQASVIIIPNRHLYADFATTLNNFGIQYPNIFAIEGLIAAYTKGDKWLSQMLEYLENNALFVIDFFKKEMPKVHPVLPEGTFLMWLDFRDTGMSQEELRKFVYRKARVALNDGMSFESCEEGFMRINIGCPRSVLEEGLARLKNALSI